MQTIRHQLWIVLAAGIVMFSNLGGPALFDEDEPKNAECAREMLARGDWVVPTFNEELRTHKPILLYWLTMTAYQVFGVTEFAARIWSALFGLGTALATYHLGRALFSAEVGLWSGLVLCTALMFDAVSRAATPCATLIFFSTLALLAFVQGVTGHRKRAALGQANTAALDIEAICLPDRWRSFALMYLAMGLAVLAKGPVGVVLPVGVLGLFLLCYGARENSDAGIEKWWQTLARTFAPARMARAAWSLRPLTGLAIVCAVALPWYVAVGIKTEGQWLAGFLGNHNVGRFLQPMEGHRGPIFYHLVTILAGFFPWSIFLPLSLVKASQQARNRTEPRWGYVFALCWAGVWVGFFSLAQTKLPNYVLPAYPALAMLTAALLVRWQKQPDLIGQWTARVALIVLALTGVGMVVGVAIAARLLLPGEMWLSLIGLIPLAGAAIAAWQWRQGSARGSYNVLA